MTITLSEHDPTWANAAALEAATLKSAVPDLELSLHHIGSTSVPGLLAKPILDLLGVVPALAPLDAASGAFAALGYEAMGAYGIPGRRYFRKDNSTGLRTHHLHVFAEGSSHVARHLAFRDYLRTHPAVAREYSALKARLRAASGDAVTYMDGKHPFIARVEADALAWACDNRQK